MFWYWQQPVAASNAIIIDTVFGNIYILRLLFGRIRWEAFLQPVTFLS